jgi:hypothetical protein
MNDHLGILQQWVHAIAIYRDRARQTGKGQCLEVEQKKKEDLDASQNGRRKGGKPEAGCVPQANDEAEPCQQPGPQQQRSLLARPERGKLVRCGQRAVGFVQDVGEGEVVGEDRPQQREDRCRNRGESHHSSAPRRIGQALRGYGASTPGRDLTQRDRAHNETADREQQGKQKRGATQYEHRFPISFVLCAPIHKINGFYRIEVESRTTL